jgi:hypothetical protein
MDATPAGLGARGAVASLRTLDQVMWKCLQDTYNALYDCVREILLLAARI